MKNLLLMLSAVFLLGIQQGNAQEKKSYLYLEVNKNLPVQVKLNNKIIPNKRKGYIIVPRINSGDNQLEFTFQNPNFEPHTFTIPTEGQKSMGLKLMRVANNKFVIQDVVNKRVISDNRTLSSAPIAINKTNKDLPTATNTTSTARKAKTKKVERGVIKVYTADTEPTKKKKVVAKKSAIKKKKQLQKTTEIVKKNTATTSEPRVLAMYKKRSIARPTSTKRYKNYAKAKREKRRASKAFKVAASPKSTKPNKNELKNKQEKQRILAREKELRQEKLNKQKAKEAKRLKARLEKEERVNKQNALEAKQLEAERLKLAQQKINRKEKREAKRLRALQEKMQQKKVEADYKETKTPKLKRKIKNYEKEIENTPTGQKVINTEPISNNKTITKKNNYNDNLEAPKRCTNQVKPERIADWTIKLHKKFDDEARMNYINKKIGSRCISTTNLGVVLGNMETQIGRYKMIRSIYPKIEDRGNMDRLYKYFQSKSYINKIKELNASNY